MPDSSRPNSAQLEPSVLTIFGITGDLSSRYLLPALYHLAENDMLPSPFKIVGVSRRKVAPSQIIENLQTSLQKSGSTCSSQLLKKIEDSLTMVSMDIAKKEDYLALKQKLDHIEDSLGRCLHRLYYLSIPATVYEPVVEQLGHHGLNHGCRHGSTESRLLVEKPFGFDFDSAQQLISTMSKSFKEDHIYRIDHYLAKETVQNILTLRDANPLLRAVWDNQHIERILIKAEESLGVENRGGSYDSIGALRDIIQSHLLQIAAVVAMDTPDVISAATVHAARQHILDAIPALTPNQIASKTVRGQYETYNKEAKTSDSDTETFAQIELAIDLPRWKGVPIFLRTGKKLTSKSTEIIITFKKAKASRETNHLTIRLQPNEGLTLNLRIKRPGFDRATEEVAMDFSYHNQAGKLSAKHPDAYERVLVDTLRGDHTLFAERKEIMASWRIVQPILDGWHKNLSALQLYAPGSSGPASANRLLEK